MPTLSRIAHLLVIDVLAVGVALRGGVATAERLRRMKAVLQDRRFPAEVPHEGEAVRRCNGRPIAAAGSATLNPRTGRDALDLAFSKEVVG